MPPKRVNLRITFYSIGLTLALTVIPMGMGYAALAGLPLQVNDILQWSTLHYTSIHQ